MIGIRRSNNLTSGSALTFFRPFPSGCPTPSAIIRERGQASTLILLDGPPPSLSQLRHAASGAHPISRRDVPRHKPGEPSAGHLSGRRGSAGLLKDPGRGLSEDWLAGARVLPDTQALPPGGGRSQTDALERGRAEWNAALLRMPRPYYNSHPLFLLSSTGFKHPAEGEIMLAFAPARDFFSLLE